MDTQPITNPVDQKQPVQTVQMVVFELDQEKYAVPILEVREVIKIPQITSVPNAQAFIPGIINLRGKVVPILDLEIRFNLVRDSQLHPEHIMIAEGDENGLIFGILVDRVSEVIKVPADIIKPPPQVVSSKISSEFLKGVVIKELEGQENIMLILDLKKILNEKETEALKTENAQAIDNKPIETVIINKEAQINE